MKKEIVKNIFSDQTDTNIALTSENNPPLLYKDLKNLTNRISRQLSGNHISNKDRAAIILPNGPYMASSFFSLFQAICRLHRLIPTIKLMNMNFT